MPLVQYSDRNVHLQSLYLLLSDPYSNIEHIFNNINILYPEFTEFTPEILGFDRALLINAFANRVYQQLRLLDPFHAYNDLIGFSDVVFAAQQYHVQELQFYLQRHINQAYKNAFITDYARNLPVSYDSLMFCYQQIFDVYRRNDVDLRLKINSMIYCGARALVLKILLPLVNDALLMPNYIVEQDLIKLNNLIEVFEFGTDDFGYNYSEEDFEIFASIAANCNDFNFIAWCVEFGVRAPDSAFFKKMQIDFVLQANYYAVTSLSELLMPIPSAETLNLFKRIKKQQDTKRLTDSIYNVVKTQLFAMPIIIDTTPLLELTNKSHAEMEQEREESLLLAKKMHEDFESKLKDEYWQKINNAIEKLDYKFLNALENLDDGERELVVSNVVERLSKLQKIDGKYRGEIRPIAYDQFVENFAIDEQSFYCLVIDSDITSRLKILVLKRIAKMDLESYCQFSNNNAFECLRIAQEILQTTDNESSKKLQPKSSKVKNKSKVSDNTSALTEEAKLLQIFIDREYAECNYGKLHYWARYDANDKEKLDLLLQELMCDLERCAKTKNRQLIHEILLDENHDSFLHVLLKYNPKSMSMALDAILKTKHFILNQILFAVNSSGFTVYNILERDFVNNQNELSLLRNLLLLAIIELSADPSLMSAAAIRIKDFFKNNSSESLVAKLITQKEYKKLIKLLELRTCLRGDLKFTYFNLSGKFFVPAFFEAIFGCNDLLETQVATMQANNYLYLERSVQQFKGNKDLRDLQTVFLSEQFKIAEISTPAINLKCWIDVLQFSGFGHDDAVNKSLHVMHAHFMFYKIDINNRNDSGINLVLNAAQKDAHRALRFLFDTYPNLEITEGDVVWVVENIPSLRCVNLICAEFDEKVQAYNEDNNDKRKMVRDIIASKKSELESIFNKCDYLTPEKIVWLQLHGVCLQQTNNETKLKLKP